MFFKKKADPNKMDAIAEPIAAFMHMSIDKISKRPLSEIDEVVIDTYLFGVVDLMAQSNKMGDTETVGKIAGLVLVKYMSVDMDQAWSRLESMVTMSKEPAGKAVMTQGGKAFRAFVKDRDLNSVFILNEIIEGDYFAAG